jgi:hypothetical protein
MFFVENTCELKIKIKNIPKDVFEVLYFQHYKMNSPATVRIQTPKKRKWKNRL